jgi:hypothetical protein
VKKPWLAFLLNFLLAGVGFAYLGKWAWAAVDLVVTIAVGYVIASRFPDSLTIAGTVIPVMNGVLAMQVAQQMNLKQKAQSGAPQPSDSGAKP